MPEWTLKTSPTEYLKRHPNGPHAAVARGILAGQLNAPDKVDPEEAGFILGKWHDQDHYQCKICPFSTTDRAWMQKHLALGQHIGGKYARHLA